MQKIAQIHDKNKFNEETTKFLTLKSQISNSGHVVTSFCYANEM